MQRRCDGEVEIGCLLSDCRGELGSKKDENVEDWRQLCSQPQLRNLSLSGFPE